MPGTWRSAALPPLVLNSTEARHDFINRIRTVPAGAKYGMMDDRGHTMDTMKVIELGAGKYAAVYHWGRPTTVILAQSIDLLNWAWKVDLDSATSMPFSAASMPYLAKEGDGGFVLADEFNDSPNTSQVKFLQASS